MSLNEREIYQCRLHKIRIHFMNIANVNIRRNEFRRILLDWSNKVRTDRVMTRVLKETLNKMFRTNQDKCFFLKRCLKDHDYKMLKLFGSSKLKINKVILDCGKSALHFLAEVYNADQRHDSGKCTLQMMNYLLNNPRKNYPDRFGFNYLHGACMTGNIAAVNLLSNQPDVDVNIDTYSCSPRGRGKALAGKRSGPEQAGRGARDAASRPSETQPVRLRVAQHVLRPQTTLRRDNSTARQLRSQRGGARSSPRHSAAVGHVGLRRGAGAGAAAARRQSRRSRPGQDVPRQVLPAAVAELSRDVERDRGDAIAHLGRFQNERFHLAEDDEVLDKGERERYRSLHLWSPWYTMKAAPYANDDYEPESCFKKIWTRETDYMKFIKLNEKVSLYQLCQMSYSQGHKILKNMMDWRCSAMEDISCNGYLIHVFVKRHVANIKIRSELEWFAADLFMSDHFNLSLPYTACRKVAELMSNEDLFRWCDEMSEEDVGQPPRKRQRLC
uniref:Uncharacterized protein n=1 Tax=Trichogramma kaykai TaxID=54128 RepID=A0ABD2WV42_9HYME